TVAVSQAGVNRPTETILLAEKHHAGNLSDWGLGSVFTGVSWWDWTAPGEIPNGAPDKGNSGTITPNGAVTPKHSEQANFVFCDGHAKSMKPPTTNPDPVNQASKNMWNATRQ